MVRKNLNVENAVDETKDQVSDKEVLYSAKVSVQRKGGAKDKKFALYGNGDVKVSGVSGGMIRVSMKPSEGAVYDEIDGLASFVENMLKSPTLSNDEKYLNMEKMKTEYYVPAVLSNFKNNSFKLKSETGSFYDCDVNALIVKKETERTLMVMAARAKQKETLELINKIKNEPVKKAATSTVEAE